MAQVSAQITSATQTTVANLYISILGRNPEPAGFGYWCEQLADNGNTQAAINQIAFGFARSPEFIATYGGRTTAQAVTLMYNNVLDRAPDAGGLAYWTDYANKLIAAGTSVNDAYALTGNAIITTAGTNNSTDTPLIVAKQTAAIASGLSTPTETYTLTTSIDSIQGAQGDDYFLAPLAGAAGTSNTLNSLDQLDGGNGRDTLLATINTSVTPFTLDSIEEIGVTFNQAGLTLNLSNAFDAELVANVNSLGNGTISGLAAGVETLAVIDNAFNTTFVYRSTTGTQEINLFVDNVTAGEITIDGVETVNVSSDDALASTYVLNTAAATALTFEGNGNQTVTFNAAVANVSSFDGSGMTGNLTLTAQAQTGVLASTDISINGGSGNDTLTVSAITQDKLIVGGAGNDVIVDTTVTVNDTIDGGNGIDALRTNSAVVANLAAADAFTNITNIERLEIADAAAGTFTLSRVGSGINTLQFNLTTAAGGATATSAAGTNLTVNIGNGSADTTTALGGALAVTDASTGISDVATIVNNSGNTAANGAFGNQNITSTGYETVNIVTTGFGNATTQVIGTISVTGDTGGTTAETVNFSGSNAVQTGAITADIVNASGLTATTGTVFQASLADATNASITGSSGNDSITSGAGNDTMIGGAGNDTLTAGAGNDDIRGGLGNDRIVFATAGNLTTADLVNGGEGTNTLVVTAADLTTNAALPTSSNLAALSRVSNMSIVEVTGIGADAASASVNVNRVASDITTVNTVAVTGATAATFTFNGGASNLNLGTGGTTAILGAATTLVAAGTGTSDSLTITKTNTVAEAVLGTVALTTTGIETLTINTGSSATLAQTTGTIAMTPTATNGAMNVLALGANALTIGAITTTGTGLLTIDGSGMTAQAAGTATLTVTAPVTTTGTVSIIGSAGDDTLNGDAGDANTISGGAGNDAITGGTGNDLLEGNAGNDTITTNGGNDTVRGGDGNDTINANAAAGTVSIEGGAGNDTVNIGATLSSGDIIDGGTGANTLRQSTALVGNFAGVTNFQTLQLDAAMTQDMSRFTGTTFTRVDTATTGTFAITGAAATLSAVRSLSATEVSVAMATDTAADALTLGAQSNLAATIGTVTVNNTELLTINAGAITTAGLDFTISALNATDLTTLTITGAQDTFVTIGTSGAGTGYGNTTAEATRTITVDASAATGTVVFNGATATSGQTQVITGSLNAANTLTGGAGTDSITGGIAVDVIVGGAGGDTINVQSGTGDIVRYTAVNQSAVISSVATGQIYTNIDLVSGMGAADIMQIVANAVTAGTEYAGVGAAANGTFVTAASTSALVNNGASLIRGNYDTLTGVWTNTATGSDTLFVYDQDALAASASYVGIVLVGVTGLAGTAAVAGGNLSITLS